jgi:hypothetical protein
MKILLLGEYSNVHWTLAEGLRALGQDVTVASNGDFWKNYRRDISLVRHSTGPLGTARYLIDLTLHLKDLKGYDVVQLINPVFLDLKAEHIYPYYEYLRRHNRKLFLCACGLDYYWVKTGLDCKTFRYGDFNIGGQIRQNTDNEQWIKEWLNGPKGELNRYIAKDCDGIVSSLYEYEMCYKPYFPEKLCFVPLPINYDKLQLITRPQVEGRVPEKVRFFVGIQKGREHYKGSDVMLRALERVATEYAGRCEVVKAMNVPYAEYAEMLNESDVLLDQLYSYTPAMNGLLAMAKGMVLVGGGEEENYEILGERTLRPIINVLPTEEDVYQKLKDVMEHPEQLPRRSREGREYVARYHDHVKVAQQYMDFWLSKM